MRNAAYYLERRLPKDQPEVAEYLGAINQEVAADECRITATTYDVAGGVSERALLRRVKHLRRTPKGWRRGWDSNPR